MGGLGRLRLGIISHFHILVGITPLLLIKVIIIIITLLLKILTASIGQIILIIVLLARSCFGALHLVVVALGGLVGLFELLDKSSLKLGLFMTVGIAVIVKVVSLGLIRWVLCGSRFLRIPRNETISIGA
jgi:hypothetical protein